MSELYIPQVRLVPPGGDHTDPLQQNYALFLYRRMDPGIEVITTQGPRGVADGVQPQPSLYIPGDYIGALNLALAKEAGRAPESDAATLQEQLLVERSRVDDQLEWLRSGDISIYVKRDA